MREVVIRHPDMSSKSSVIGRPNISFRAICGMSWADDGALWVHSFVPLFLCLAGSKCHNALLVFYVVTTCKNQVSSPPDKKELNESRDGSFFVRVCTPDVRDGQHNTRVDDGRELLHTHHRTNIAG